jgi:hypothetical protein
MKRNLLKIPKGIIERIRHFDVDDIVAACAKRLRPEDIENYSHLGLELKDGKLIVPDRRLPPMKSGRYSKANVEGLEKVCKDLPTTQKTFYWDTPNWGDWSKGFHTHSRTRDVYQCDFFPPKLVEMTIALVRTHENPTQYLGKV